ncbi:hypothetical protein [Shewanella halotolerans]|uniref:hypothetical protein n=1 Tax=Shewanella halotolerans TaxID=2864204 RepID=UPI001C6575C1|nr:hypothetical protein [Shewanella halotolerans]QYJ89424.1 hypothetical protein K0H81_16875 [Shewanella halotolerans]
MSNHNLAIILLTLPLLGGAMACEPNSDAEKAKNKPKVQQSAAQAGSEPVREMSPVKADNSQGDHIVPNHRLPFEQKLDEKGKAVEAQSESESAPCQADTTEQADQSESPLKSEEQAAPIKPGEAVKVSESVKPGESNPECDKPRQE